MARRRRPLNRLFRRFFVERIANSHTATDADPTTVLHLGDKVALTGRCETLASVENPPLAYEVNEPDLLDIPVVTVDHVLTRRDLDHRTLAEVAETIGSEVPTRGVFVRQILRSGKELPIGSRLSLKRGDILRLVGVKRHVERVAARLGSIAWPGLVACWLNSRQLDSYLRPPRGE
jgi:putative transport protein